MKNNSKSELEEIVVEKVTVVEDVVPVESDISYSTTLSSGDGGSVGGNEVISSAQQSNEHANSIPSHDNTSSDPAQSKLKENSNRDLSSNNRNVSPGANNYSSAANRLRNNNGANHNNPLANRNNSSNNGLGDKNNNDLGNKTNDDKVGQKLRNNKFNKARNLPFFNRKKKKQGTENDNDNSSDNSIDNNASASGDEKADLIKKAKKIKMIFSIVMACLPVVFIILVLVAIVSTMGSLINMFSIVATGGGGDFPTAMTDNPNEKKYYEKLDSVVASYQKSCGISLNKNYIHAILFYPIQNYDEFFDQDFSIDETDSSNDDIDYSSLTGKINTVAKLMVNNCSVDYEVGGTSYERIKNSSFFKSYYKDLLDNSSADDILASVFDLAEVATDMFYSSWYINDNLKVVLRTCNTYQYLNGTKENSTVGFSEYIMGVVYGELDTNLEIIPENKEFLKAQVVAASSYVLSRAKYQPGDSEIEASNGDCWQLSCNINEGCTYAYDLGTYGTCYTGIQDKVKVDWKRNPISSSKLSLLNEVMNEVFGIVMLDPSGNIKWSEFRDGSCGSDCMGQKPGMVDAQNGMTYEEILEKYYDNFTLSNVSEDLYADVTYEEGGYTSNIVYYNQNDYNDKFCGRTDGTIATSGCGVVSMSIVLSTLLDDSFTPPVVMEEAYGFGSCGKGISGTATSFFKKSAQLHNLGYQRVGKKGDLQAVLNALNSGNSLVIAHMGPGTFTRSGHYIVLARVNNEGEVYVYDPNKSSRNGWHDFNSVVVKQLRGSFYIITKE